MNSAAVLRKPLSPLSALDRQGRAIQSDATDQNGVYSDFDDYQTQYFTDGFYARPKGMRYPGGVKLAYLYDFNGYLTHERDPVS